MSTMRPWLIRLLGIACCGYGVEALTFSAVDSLTVGSYVIGSLFVLAGLFMVFRAGAIVDLAARVRDTRRPP